MYLDTDLDNGSDGVRYTTGSLSFSNADLKLDLGAGIWGDFGSIAVFGPRTWNGTLFYSIDAAPPIPTTSEWGLIAFGLMFLSLGAIILVRRREAAV